MGVMITFGSKPDPVWLAVGAIAVVGLLWWSLKTARGDASRGRKLVLVALRVLVVAVIAFVLLDPQLMRELKSYRPGRVVVLLDSSRSMNVREAGGTTRIEFARAWLKNHLQMPDGFTSSEFEFQEELIDPAAWMAGDPARKFEATGGRHTGILDALAGLADATAAEPPSSVLLVSDGADTGSVRGNEVGARYARLQVPINTLLIGSTNEPPDLRIESVDPRLVTDKRTMVQVRASLSAPGFAGTQATVRVLNEKLVVAAKQVPLTGESQTVELSFPPHRNGFQTFALRVDPLPGERLTDNNRREFGLTVIDPTLRVLYMEATAINREMPEIFFLKHALEDEPGIEVRALFFDQHGAASISTREQIAYIDPRNGDKIYRVQHSRYGYPKTLPELLRYHVVICSDVARTAFTREQMDDAVRYVEEFGGGFVMVGGETSFGAGYYDQTPIEKIIPVEMKESRDNTDAGFSLRPSPAALAHPILQVAPEPEANRAAWAKLPSFGGFNRVDRAKPGAVVLWEHPGERNQYGPRVILAVQQIGKGRSMAFTTDTTSAWGYQFERMWGEPTGASPGTMLGNDARYYKQFWVNAVRWLAAHRFEKEHMPVKLEVGKSDCRPGEEVPFSATVELLDQKPLDGLKAGARLWNDERLVQEAQLVWDPAAGAWRGVVAPDRIGHFTLRFVVTDQENRASEVTHLITADEFDRELAEVRARTGLLAGLAGQTGGKMLDVTSSQEEVTAALGGLNVVSVKYEKEPLWDTWVWLALIIGLLTVEWIVRRTGGLA